MKQNNSRNIKKGKSYKPFLCSKIEVNELNTSTTSKMHVKTNKQTRQTNICDNLPRSSLYINFRVWLDSVVLACKSRNPFGLIC